MQRNFTPQGKPQEPSALDAKLKAEAIEQLKALHARLVLKQASIGLLVESVTKALDDVFHRDTSGHLSQLVRDVRYWVDR